MVERTCLECGETWTLPAKLARRRRRRGFSVMNVAAARRGPMMMLSNAGMEMQMDELKRRDAQSDRDLDVTRQLRECPKCGSSGRYTERPVR